MTPDKQMLTARLRHAERMMDFPYWQSQMQATIVVAGDHAAEVAEALREVTRGVERLAAVRRVIEGTE